MTKAPAFIVQPNTAIIRVDPNTQQQVKVLTEADFTGYMKRAESARQAQQAADLLPLVRFR